MEAKQWTTIDKSTWERGPWDNEPDKAQWVDEATGLPCLIVRNNGGALCGYVGVSRGHPWFEQSYDESAHVHGGLTFADKCRPGVDESSGICHIVAPGEDDAVWWLGFDCSHGGDISPAHDALLRSIGHKPLGVCNWWETATYRDFPYVKEQCGHLARQAKAAASP